MVGRTGPGDRTFVSPTPYRLSPAFACLGVCLALAKSSCCAELWLARARSRSIRLPGRESPKQTDCHACAGSRGAKCAAEAAELHGAGVRFLDACCLRCRQPVLFRSGECPLLSYFTTERPVRGRGTRTRTRTRTKHRALRRPRSSREGRRGRPGSNANAFRLINQFTWKSQLNRE